MGKMGGPGLQDGMGWAGPGLQGLGGPQACRTGGPGWPGWHGHCCDTSKTASIVRTASAIINQSLYYLYLLDISVHSGRTSMVFSPHVRHFATPLWQQTSIIIKAVFSFKPSIGSERTTCRAYAT